MNWLNENMVIAGLIGIALGITAKYVVRAMKDKKDK